MGKNLEGDLIRLSLLRVIYACMAIKGKKLSTALSKLYLPDLDTVLQALLHWDQIGRIFSAENEVESQQ